MDMIQLIVRIVVAATMIALPVSATQAGSLYFGVNRPEQFDFGDLRELPAGFGEGEFTFELWIKADARYPVGQTYRGTKDQLANWSISDPKPYSNPGWWLAGNFLLDGHSRPNGFGPGDTRAGTFSLQFYGGGRLRWTFADAGTDMPAGMVYAVQADDTPSAPSLLDDRWHHLAAVRRWRDAEGATLELWIDGHLVGKTNIPRRVNMRQFWDNVPHPDDPPNLGGWAFGSEVMTAWDMFFTQYEDYKGWIDEMHFWSRALSTTEIERAATSSRPIDAPGLIGRFAFDEGEGDHTCDAINPLLCMKLYRMTTEGWSAENAPVR